jgi:hypothetical protein
MILCVGVIERDKSVRESQWVLNQGVSTSSVVIDDAPLPKTAFVAGKISRPPIRLHHHSIHSSGHMSRSA